MAEGPNGFHREALMAFGLVSAALYFILLGYVFNYQGRGGMALISALAAMVVVLPLYRSLWRWLSAR